MEERRSRLTAARRHGPPRCRVIERRAARVECTGIVTPERIEGDTRELLGADPEDPLAVPNEARITAEILRRHARDLPLHRRIVGEAIEMAAVVGQDPVVGIERARIDIVRKFSSAQAPEVLESERAAIIVGPQSNWNPSWTKPRPRPPGRSSTTTS